MTATARPICTGCMRHADAIGEYREAVADAGDPVSADTCDAYIRQEEGTYNPENGHFLCTACYIAAGCPTAPGTGWVAP